MTGSDRPPARGGRSQAPRSPVSPSPASPSPGPSPQPPVAGAFAVQGAFGASLVDSTGRDDPTVLAEILPGGTLSHEQAVAVYRQGYYARLAEQLGETFEAVWAVLGDEPFFRVCAEYAADHPSTSYNLSDYGASFPQWLEGTPEFSSLPFLCELADFEWKFMKLFHIEQHAGLCAEDLAGIPDFESARIEVGRACHLFSARHAVYSIWKQRGETPAKASLEQGVPEAWTSTEPAVGGRVSGDVDWTQPERGLAYKRGGEIFVRVLDPGSFRMLTALFAGETFGAAVAAAASEHPDLSAEDVSSLFQTIAHSQIVTGIDPLLT